jgi:hypothetical protein
MVATPALNICRRNKELLDERIKNKRPDFSEHFNYYTMPRAIASSFTHNGVAFKSWLFFGPPEKIFHQHQNYYPPLHPLSSGATRISDLWL